MCFGAVIKLLQHYICFAKAADQLNRRLRFPKIFDVHVMAGIILFHIQSEEGDPGDIAMAATSTAAAYVAGGFFCLFVCLFLLSPMLWWELCRCLCWWFDDWL